MGLPGAGPDTGGLLADYGGVRAEPSSRKRAQRLAELLVRSLRSSGISAAVRGEDPLVSVAFRDSGHPYVIGLAQTAEWELPAGEDAVHETRRSSPGASVIVLSASGFAAHRASEAAGSDSGGTVLWDRTHLEAVLCGLVSLPDLLDASINAAFFRNAPHEPLARLLSAPAGDDTAPRMATPDQLPPPWPVTGSGQPGSGARLALTGEGAWPRPSGIAALEPGRLLVVTPAGLIDLDTVRGTGSWLMRLPRCVNEPLVLPDGSVLAVRGRAVARVTATAVEAVGGEFDGSPRLLAGPGGEPWVLSGRGSGTPGEGTLALTRLGDRPGDQHRYGVDCAGDVRAAVWLDGLRFFLAAPGRSAVVDLARSTRVAGDDWIDSRWSNPAHLASDGPERVITAAAEPGPPGPQARVTLFRTDLRARACEPVTEVAFNEIGGLCADAEGTGYLLGDVGSGPDTWPALVRIPGLRTAAARGRVPARAAPDPAFPQSRWDAVRMAARGRDRDYELDPHPVDRGGQAEVFGARHRQTGLRVAFKRLRRRAPYAMARMRREIEAAQALGDSPHVMPVLDYSPRYDWLVMPLADESAAAAEPSLRDDDALRALVNAVCEGLRHAHETGWIHRDLKPANLLRLGGTWTVADWGLVRRPLGATTQPGRTRLGAAFGTVGFGAPELSPDPHHADPRADIYSIGQIIGWAVTGRMPQANTPLLPAHGPWRQVVRAATQRDPARRPATVDALLQLVAEELDYERPDISGIAGRLSKGAGEGDAQAAADLFALAARYPDDTLLYTETLPAMTRDAVIAAVDATRHDTIELSRAMTGRARDSGLAPDQAARITTLLHWIQARADDTKDLGLLEEVTRSVLAWDEQWSQEAPRREIARWLPLQRGDQAAAVARALREAPGAARHFTSVLHDDQADERVRRAIRAALNLTPSSGAPTETGADAVADTAPVRHQLPADLNGFVGRAGELAQIARLLNSGRLVTVTGSRGAGKTRLALRAAAQAAAAYRDGVCLVELTGARAPAAFPGFLAAGLGLGDAGMEDVLGYLRDRELLIVLDACDHLAGPCADFVSRVLRDAPGTVVLATGERPLGVAGERCLPVQPLAVPSQRKHPDGSSDAGGERALFARCTPAEQALWRRLSVFSDLFDRTAAEEVCADATLDAGTVAEALAGLAAKSAVTVQESARSTRYRLSDACRQLGMEKLAASSQEKLFRGRHFARCLAVSRRFAAGFPGQDGAAALRQVRACYPDIRAALEYASSGELGETAQGTGAADLAVALADFWSADGRLRDGRYWLRRCAGRCPYPSRDLAQALIVGGHLDVLAGQARDGAADIREGIRIASGLGEPGVTALGNLHLTQALTFAEYYEEAAAAATEAYRLFRKLDDDFGRFRLQAELAFLETLAGSPEQAVARCENALRNHSSEDGWIRGYLHAVMAFAQFQGSRQDPSCETSARDALRVYQEFGDRTGIASALELLGWLAARAGRHVRTAWLLGAAGCLWEAAGSRLGNVPAMEELHAAAEAAARDALSHQRFEAVQAMGSGSPLNEVIAFAIGDVSIQVVS